MELDRCRLLYRFRGWSGALATSGSQSIGPLTSNTTYSLVCSSSAGSSSSVASATVNVTPTATLTVSPTTLTTGASATLSWSSKNATSCMASGDWSGTQPTSGSVGTGTLTSNASYALTCTGAGGTSNAAQTAVTVVPAGPVTLSPTGAIYAQPLWVAGLTLNGTVHNVIFVATAHDGLFAFDADASPCEQLWQADLIDTSHGASSGETTVAAGTTGNLVGGGTGDITPERCGLHRLGLA